MPPHQINVNPLTYQSGDISFSQWMQLLTLCLAPLIAHIIAGAPEPTYLCRSRQPRWHERMCIYSPFTILWRYAAITDRRIRAVDWSASDLAATNAIFWTSHGWDGSEEMVTQSVPYCVRLPSHTRMTLFSSDSIKTVIITLQGIQAIFLTGAQAYKDGGNLGFLVQFHTGVSFGNITAALALFGLLRLFAAFWITGEFSYVALDEIPPGSATVAATSISAMLHNSWSSVSCDSLQIMPVSSSSSSSSNHQFREAQPSVYYLHHSGMKSRPSSSSPRFKATSTWSKAFRLIYILLYLIPCIVSLGRIFIIQDSEILQLSATAMLTTVYLALAFVFCVAVYGYYAVRHGCRTTIIPCIDKAWYKGFTLFAIAGWVSLLVVSAVETRRVSCGRYTTSLVGSGDDAILCPG